jgi:hypothetical protein
MGELVGPAGRRGDSVTAAGELSGVAADEVADVDARRC